LLSSTAFARDLKNQLPAITVGVAARTKVAIAEGYPEGYSCAPDRTQEAIMSSSRAIRILAGKLTVAMVLTAASLIGRQASAQSLPTPPAGARPPVKDYNQRSLEIYEFRKAAQSGPERGQEIYYFKCWFCHNEFVKGIPHLEGLYKKPTLLSGQPVNDANVKEKLRNGGPTMPAYKYALKDEDLDDLVSYLREKCC
jgi:mono/diheme cytochrome c family protein